MTERDPLEVALLTAMVLWETTYNTTQRLALITNVAKDIRALVRQEVADASRS